MNPENYDLIVIGAGPGGSAAAITAARSGARVIVLEKGDYGRDKICGDGLTPRAIKVLDKLGFDYGDAHRIRGLRMQANGKDRELDWASDGRFPSYGAVWRRTELDAALIDAAIGAGADIRYNSTAIPLVETTAANHQRCIGVEVSRKTSEGVKTSRIYAPMTFLAAGAAGKAARVLGATRLEGETYGLAIRAYAKSPRHDDDMLEACLTMSDAQGRSVPGYGWMFPCGDGTVNVGTGALSSMKGFKHLNLNELLEIYRKHVQGPWELGEWESKPRAWRLPMTVEKRQGPGWMAVGDAAGMVNPMNGEGIDYALEAGTMAAEFFIQNPETAPDQYEIALQNGFDEFLKTGRRFSLLIGHPWILKSGLRFAMSTDKIANITLQVMGNLVEADTGGSVGKTYRGTEKLLAKLEPVLRRTKADPGKKDLAGPKAADQAR